MLVANVMVRKRSNEDAFVYVLIHERTRETEIKSSRRSKENKMRLN